jgi:negative regulator of flagellin synthesis FlgM
MTIHSIGGKPYPPLNIKTSVKTDSNDAKEPVANASEKTDSIAITAIAKEIHKAFESSSAAVAIDFDRVSAVKKALSEGSYAIDAENVAKKMILFEKLMSKMDSS